MSNFYFRIGEPLLNQLWEEYLHAKSPLQLLHGGLCIHKVHCKHVLFEIQIAISIQIQGSEGTKILNYTACKIVSKMARNTGKKREHHMKETQGNHR